MDYHHPGLAGGSQRIHPRLLVSGALSTSGLTPGRPTGQPDGHGELWRSMSEKRGKEKLEVSDREQGRCVGEGQVDGDKSAD